MKRGPILLLGANGLLGRELAARLPALAERIGPLHAATRQMADFSHLDGLTTLLRSLRPALIVNAAAYTDVDAAERDSAIALAVNAAAPQRLGEIAHEIGAGLLHFSTDHVFGGARPDNAGAPWREDDPPAPVNAYGRSKLAGELAIRASGCHHLILRTAWLHGPRQRGFVFKVLERARRGDTIAVVDDQFGHPTAADQLAATVVQALARWHADAGLGGLLHLADAGATSRFGLACRIVEAAQRLGIAPPAATVIPARTAATPGIAPRPADARLNCDFFDTRFGLRRPPWAEGIERTLTTLANCA